jgi:hypothetical protein
MIGLEGRDRSSLTRPAKGDHIDPVILKRWLSGVLGKDRDLVSLAQQFLCKIPGKNTGKGILALTRIRTGCDAEPHSIYLS